MSAHGDLSHDTMAPRRQFVYQAEKALMQASQLSPSARGKPRSFASDPKLSRAVPGSLPVSNIEVYGPIALGALFG